MAEKSKKKPAGKKPSGESDKNLIEDFITAQLMKRFAMPTPPEATLGIGEDPAHTVNLKKVVDDFVHMGLNSHQQAGLLFNLTYLDSLTSMSRTKVIAERAMGDIMGNSKAIDSRSLIHVPTTDVARDRIWNFTDEIMAQVVGSTGMNRDSVVAVLAAVLTKLVTETGSATKK